MRRIVDLRCILRRVSEPCGEGAHGQGKEQRQEVSGEKGETKEVTLVTAFSERKASPEARAKLSPILSLWVLAATGQTVLPLHGNVSRRIFGTRPISQCVSVLRAFDPDCILLLGID